LIKAIFGISLKYKKLVAIFFTPIDRCLQHRINSGLTSVEFETLMITFKGHLLNVSF